MDQRIDQQLLQRRFGNLQLAQGVEATAALHVVQVAADKGEAALELLQQRAANILAVQITAIGQRGLETLATVYGGMPWGEVGQLPAQSGQSRQAEIGQERTVRS
ncbi:hypothetical protein D3C78_1124150 [compost metagenome]